MEIADTVVPALLYTTLTIFLMRESLSKERIFVRNVIRSSLEKGRYLVNVKVKIIKGMMDKSIKKAAMAPKAPT